MTPSKMLLNRNGYALHAMLKTLHPVAYRQLEREVELRPIPTNETLRFTEARWQCERFQWLVENFKPEPQPAPKPPVLTEPFTVGDRVVSKETGWIGTVTATVTRANGSAIHMVRWDKNGVEGYMTHNKLRVPL